jgi:tetratricopeptide (TPR) repeat protein
MGRFQEGLMEVKRVLDRTKPAGSRYLLDEAVGRDTAAVCAWWAFLRKRSPAELPSAALARLRGWFVDGKADADFDALVNEAERADAPPGVDPDPWRGAVARACLAVGRSTRAEELLRAWARGATTAAASLALGDFYLQRKRYAEAGAEYGRALQREPAHVLALYLRGVALGRVGRDREGQALREQARLLPLADEEARYNLIQALSKRGLKDEADAERLLLVRTGPFRSIYTANIVGRLADRASRRKQHHEAARYYRRLYLCLALGNGGGFTEDSDYLRVPAWAHECQARAFLAEGKLDEAVREARLHLEYLPEEIDLPIDLVRALDRANRRMDATRFFDEVFARHASACAETPRMALCHNRLAWLAARCGRRLDRALRHAHAATVLAPTEAGYLDTLAEVHFQRGDRSAALAAIRRAVKLSPANAFFAAQLRRIEAGDRDAPVPEE